VKNRKKRLKIAGILIFIVDVVYAAWGAMAAAMPDDLLGPGGKPILPAPATRASPGVPGRSLYALLR